MHIKKSLPHEKFTKVDNKIFTHPGLSDGAVRLYGFLASLPNGKTVIDAYIIRAMGMSQAVLTRRKKELKDVNLILMVQLTPKVYDLYIGHTGMSAQDVKAVWEREHDEVR